MSTWQKRKNDAFSLGLPCDSCEDLIRLGERYYEKIMESTEKRVAMCLGCMQGEHGKAEGARR